MEFDASTQELLDGSKPLLDEHPSAECNFNKLDTMASLHAHGHSSVLLTRKPSRVVSALILPPIEKPRHVLERLESSSTISLATVTMPWAKCKEAKSMLLSLISALYGLMIVIIAFSLEVSTFINENSSPSDYDVFFVALYSISLLFFAYCYVFLLNGQGCARILPFHKKHLTKELNQNQLSASQPWLALGLKSRTHKVSYATSTNIGSMYLRFGATLFGIIGIIDKATNVFMAIESHQFEKCYHIVNLAEDTIGAVFIFVQLYFIFENSEISIHKLPEISRLGTVHLIATNICLWMRSILAEEHHLIMNIQRHSKKHSVEYAASSHSSSGEEIPLNLKIQENDCNSQHEENVSSTFQLKSFLTTCLIEYTVICAAIMYVMWRNIGAKQERIDKSIVKARKRNVNIDCSDSTKGFFIGLIFLMLTLISMIIFFAKVNKNQYLQALIICHVSDSMLYVAAIAAIIIAFYRMRNLHYSPSSHKGLLLDDILLIVGLLSQLMMCIFSVVALSRIDLTTSVVVAASLLRMIEVLLQTVFIFYAQRLSTPGTSRYDHHSDRVRPGREFVAFLLIVNLAMFLINTFETQKSGSNPVTVHFYGKTLWTIIVYSTVPLNTFYRFHSSVCLAEIWKTTYRIK